MDVERLEKHKLHHTNQEKKSEEWKHICQICFFKFPTDFSLTLHTRSKHPKKVWSCECGKIFLTQKFNSGQSMSNAYKKHLKETCSAHPDVAQNFPFECQHCQKRLRTKRALDIHVGQRHADHYYKCEKCSMQHSNKLLHLRHVGNCTGQKTGPNPRNTTCDACGKKCQTNLGLLKHRASKNCPGNWFIETVDELAPNQV